MICGKAYKSTHNIINRIRKINNKHHLSHDANGGGTNRFGQDKPLHGQSAGFNQSAKSAALSTLLRKYFTLIVRPP